MAKQTNICQECNNTFTTFNPKQRFCCRSCYAKEDSRRKKEKYETQPHHNIGRVVSDSERKMRALNTKKSWENTEIRQKRLMGLKLARQNSEYSFGWSPEDREKRNKTIEANGGHNLSGKFGTRQCDITFLQKYGKPSYELLNDKTIKKSFTKPEKQVYEILTKHNIKFQAQYKFRGRYFDFAIPLKKILIEVDGTYWHGKDLTENELNETQKKTRENDIYKNVLVESSDWKLIRIWSDEIDKFNFKEL